MSNSTHTAVPEDIAANVQQLANSAQLGCGCSYEVYQNQFSQRVDALLATIKDPKVKTAILEAAGDCGYVKQEEWEATQEEWMNEGLCSHGFDPDCCPLGCGDLPEYNLPNDD